MRYSLHAAGHSSPPPGHPSSPPPPPSSSLVITSPQQTKDFSSVLRHSLFPVLVRPVLHPSSWFPAALMKRTGGGFPRTVCCWGRGRRRQFLSFDCRLSEKLCEPEWSCRGKIKPRNKASHFFFSKLTLCKRKKNIATNPSWRLLNKLMQR